MRKPTKREYWNAWDRARSYIKDRFRSDGVRSTSSSLDGLTDEYVENLRSTENGDWEWIEEYKDYPLNIDESDSNSESSESSLSVSSSSEEEDSMDLDVYDPRDATN